MVGVEAQLDDNTETHGMITPSSSSSTVGAEMKFRDGLVIGGASGIGATLFFGRLTELLALVVLVGVAVWRFNKWNKKDTLSTEKKSPSSYP